MKATIILDMFAQTAVQHFMSKRQSAIAVEIRAAVECAHLNNTKLESGQEDANSKHTVQTSNHAAGPVVNLVNVAADNGNGEMISGEIVAHDDQILIFDNHSIFNADNCKKS